MTDVRLINPGFFKEDFSGLLLSSLNPTRSSKPLDPLQDFDKEAKEQESRSFEKADQQFEATATEEQVCATCPKVYALTFEIKDANGNPCEGMYYTVRFKRSGQTISNGKAKAGGMTDTFETSDPNQQIFLYIGHRTEEDGYPEEQSGEENTYDEAFLASDTVAVKASKKICQAQTQRLWKPWKFSEESARHTINNWEKRRSHIYDDRYPKKDWDGTHTNGERLTIGAGHLLASEQEAADYLRKYPTSGTGMSNEEMDELFRCDVLNRAREQDANNDIRVPLYQREFDAFVDLRFNGGSGASDFDGGFSNVEPHTKILPTSSVTERLNRGRYSFAGERFVTTANSAKVTEDGRKTSKWSRGVQNRRNFEKKMFFGEE